MKYVYFATRRFMIIPSIYFRFNLRNLMKNYYSFLSTYIFKEHSKQIPVLDHLVLTFCVHYYYYYYQCNCCQCLLILALYFRLLLFSPLTLIYLYQQSILKIKFFTLLYYFIKYFTLNYLFILLKSKYKLNNTIYINIIMSLLKFN